MSAEISIEWIKANAAFVASRIVKLERENADLRAKLARLDGLTNWVCSCGGTDCKGQEENAALKAAYNKLETDLMDEVDDLRFENAGLRVELERQAVCNGKGSEREAALRAKVETLERENAALRAALTPWLAWEDTGGDIPASAARRLFQIARAAIDAARKEKL